MDPIRIIDVENQGIRYPLTKPLLVDVDRSDDSWVLHNDSLNLWGYGDSKEDALQDLYSNFAYIVDAFGDEDDDQLDSKALQIKKSLHEYYQPAMTT